jgi:hypothetical protein
MKGAGDSAPTHEKYKLNWANECIAGALLSAAFTVLAAYAGTAGVKAASLSHHIYEIMNFGGLSMALILGSAAIILTLYKALRSIIRGTAFASKEMIGPTVAFRS